MHYNTLRYRRRIKKLHELLGGKCVKCGSKKHLHFHHIDKAQKIFVVSQEWDAPWDLLLAEIKKCELLCFRCHKSKHRAVHGSLGMYSHNKCRCQKCRDAWNLKTKQYKLNAKLKRLT